MTAAMSLVPISPGSEAFVRRRLQQIGVLAEVERACSSRGVTLAAMCSRSRLKSVVAARHEAWLALYASGQSSTEIGQIFGVDHSTVLSAVHKPLRPVEATCVCPLCGREEEENHVLRESSRGSSEGAQRRTRCAQRRAGDRAWLGRGVARRASTGGARAVRLDADLRRRANERNPGERRVGPHDGRCLVTPEQLHNAMGAAFDEAIRAHEKYGDFVSAHHGYGVLAEEVAELFDAVRMRETEQTRNSQLRHEAIQVAAVALRIAAQAGVAW